MPASDGMSARCQQPWLFSLRRSKPVADTTGCGVRREPAAGSLLGLRTPYDGSHRRRLLLRVPWFPIVG